MKVSACLYVTDLTTVWCYSGRIVDRAVLRLYSPGGSLAIGLNLGMFVIHPKWRLFLGYENE